MSTFTVLVLVCIGVAALLGAMAGHVVALWAGVR